MLTVRGRTVEVLAADDMLSLVWSSTTCRHKGERNSSMTFAGRLHAPGPLYSGLMMIPDPSVASVPGNCGLDFVSVDAERGQYTPDALRACLAALKAGAIRRCCPNQVERRPRRPASA